MYRAIKLNYNSLVFLPQNLKKYTFQYSKAQTELTVIIYKGHTSS